MTLLERMDAALAAGPLSYIELAIIYLTPSISISTTMQNAVRFPEEEHEIRRYRLPRHLRGRVRKKC